MIRELLRVARRVWLRSPIVMGAATLLLAIAASSAGLYDATMRTLLGDPDDLPRQVGTLRPAMGGVGSAVHPAALIDARSFASVTAFRVARAFAITPQGPAGEVVFAEVGPRFAETIGAPPHMGRSVLDQPDDALISYGLWRRKRAGSLGIIGTSLVLDGTPYRISGVMPRSFRVPEGVDVWVPWRGDLLPSSASHAVVRLRQGVTWDEARAELTARVGAADAASVALASLRERREEKLRTVVRGTLIPVLLVLGCSFLVALLFMSTAVERRRVTWIRASLGASRTRLVVGWIAEVGAVVLPATLLSLALLKAAALVLGRTSGPGHLVLDGPLFQASTLVVVPAIAAVAGLVAGLPGVVELLRVTSMPSPATFKGAGGFNRYGIADVLIVAQVAGALGLALAFGLLMGSADLASRVSWGHDTGQLYAATLRWSAPPSLTEVLPALERTNGRPGVSVALLSARPVASCSAMEAGVASDLSVVGVTDTYWDTLGVQTVLGAPWDGGGDAVLLSASAAAVLWTGENPVGRQLRVSEAGAHVRYRDVVGVVPDIDYLDHDGRSRLVMYERLTEDHLANAILVVRAPQQASPVTITEMLTGDVASLHSAPLLPYADTMKDLMTGGREAGVALRTLGLIAAFCVVMALVGCGAAVHSLVKGARQELGIRLALGATPHGLVLLAARRGAVLIVMGALLGVPAPVAYNLLHPPVGVSAHALVSQGWPWVVVLTIGLSSALVCWLSAASAASAVPSELLKAE